MIRFAAILPLLCLLAAPWFVGAAVMVAAVPQAEAAEGSKTTNSLQKRRQRSRVRQISRQRRQCQVYAARVKWLREVACFKGDTLDARRNICIPRGGAFPSYSRWDRAAGRCRPRDIYEGGSCKSSTRRYQPGQRHAQTKIQSMRMYGRVARSAVSALNQCRATLSVLRQRAATRTSKERNDCRIARSRRDADLIRSYCE
jgi:hypothetical protein